MRRIALRIDRLPAWAFVAASVAAFGAARAGRLFALTHRNRGGMELGNLLILGAFLVILIFVVRRRQVSAAGSTIQLLSAMVIGNALAIAAVWPLMPSGLPISLLPFLRDTIADGAVTAVIALPLSVLLVWLSRRFGSHSMVTEPRLRVIQEVLRRRAR